MPCICLPNANMRRAPTESIVKLVILTFAFWYEISKGWINIKQASNSIAISNLHTPSTHQVQHSLDDDKFFVFKTWKIRKESVHYSTIYSSFILGSLVEILLHFKAQLPRRLDGVCLVFGYIVEALIFAVLLRDTKPLEINLQLLLIATVLVCVLFSILELCNEKQVLYTYGRIMFTFLQGTWLYQSGLILHPLSKEFTLNPEDKYSIANVILVYCWHMLAVMIFLLLELWLVKKIYFGAHNQSRLMILDELIYLDCKNDECDITRNDGSNNETTIYSKYMVSNLEDEVKMLIEED